MKDRVDMFGNDLWTFVSKNLPTVLALVGLFYGVVANTIEVQSLRRDLTVQAAQISEAQLSYNEINLQLTAIKTVLNESIKPDITVIKRDVKDLQSR
jgi:hypothetical protein